jgi:hypothetical protein
MPFAGRCRSRVDLDDHEGVAQLLPDPGKALGPGGDVAGEGQPENVDSPRWCALDPGQVGGVDPQVPLVATEDGNGRDAG